MPNYTGEIIGAAATIIAVPLTIAGTKWMEHRELVAMNRERRVALAGLWRGALEQEGPAVPGLEIGNAEITLQARRRRIVGAGTFASRYQGQDRLLQVVLEGGFLYDRFIKLDYRNKKAGSVQFGAIVLEFTSGATQLRGGFVGFGSVSERIVTGKLTLDRVQE